MTFGAAEVLPNRKNHVIIAQLRWCTVVMSSEFNAVALSRARYYTKGSPVQFVHVELLRMEDTGNMVVTLTFKNIAPQQTLTEFTAHFRCKDAQGNVVDEDDFTYTELNAAEGELFGSDDAVFVSEVPLSSVEVHGVRACYGPDRQHDLSRCKPVPLPMLRLLPPAIAQKVNSVLQMDTAQYVPVNLADGWLCTCGAFNYNVGRGVAMCTECGTDKASLYSAVRDAAHAEQTPQMPVQPDEAFLPVTDDTQTQVAAAAAAAKAAQRAGQPEAVPASATSQTTAYHKGELSQTENDPNDPDNPYSRYYDSSKTMVMSSSAAAQSGKKKKEVSWMKTKTAEWILKYVPFITAGASVGYVLVLVLIHALIS